MNLKKWRKKIKQREELRRTIKGILEGVAEEHNRLKARKDGTSV